MARVISLFLPLWPTDRWRRSAPLPAEAPLVLAARAGNRRVVTAADAAARALGLCAGMAVARAQALVPGLMVHPADTAADAAGLARLALWAQHYVAPLVAVDAPDGIVIDATGAAHLHGGEAAMLALLRARLRKAGCAARAAIADSWGAAHALARYGARPLCIVPPGKTAPAIAPLPLAALRLPPATVDALADLGFARVADLIGQPRAPLARRFGREPGRRLDEALALVPEPITPIHPPELPVAELRFAEPIATPEAIAHQTGRLCETLCHTLARRGLGARRLDLVCARVDSATQAVRIGLAQPRRDAAGLLRLLAERIETIAPGFGIDSMALIASRTQPLPPAQMVSALAAAQTPDLSGLIDTLANRVGGACVYRCAAVASDVPERSVQRVAALAAADDAGWPARWPRPARLLARPQPIETMALLPDHPPVWFLWRGVRHRLRCADGPERIFGEWWKRDAERVAVRDYFRVEDEAGARFWIFRAGDGTGPETGSQRWFLHGFFG